MTITLRPYQREAVSFLLSKDRAILADEVGVGKTYPAISAALQVQDASTPWSPILVICPAYLMQQWKEAIQTYAPDDDVLLLYRDTDVWEHSWNACTWVVTSYHTLQDAHPHKVGGKKRPDGSISPVKWTTPSQPRLLTDRWNAVIFDEAHRLRGRSSLWTKHAYKLKADRIWMLTGTPLVNNPSDIWPLLRLCDPKTYTSYWDFVGTWCRIDQTPYGSEVGPVKPEAERSFHALLDNYLIRRRVEDVLPDLPPAIDHTVTVELPKSYKKAHDQAKHEWFIEHPDLDDPIVVTSGGALVHKLRQLTAGTLSVNGSTPKQNPKRDAVLDIIDDLSGEPVIAFCAYKATAKLIHDALAKRSRPVTLATGDHSPPVRAVAVERWKTQPDGILVATIPAMQEGANLQHARNIIFAEHSYLMTDIEQAIARARRFGQEFPVNVHHIMCKGTVDEAVWRVAQRRGKNNERALLADLRDSTPGLPPFARKAVAAAAVAAFVGGLSLLSG